MTPVLASDKTINDSPQRSVLNIDLGEKISFREPQFVRLADAFLGDLELKFVIN